MASSSHEVTGLLRAWGNGDERALARLAPLVDAELHRLAESFLGEEAIAEVLKISLRTVQREWSLARAWLYQELAK